MMNGAFAADTAARRVMRLLLVLQLAGIAFAIFLRLLGAILPSLTVSILMLALLPAALFWLYGRYRRIPAVREKHALENLRDRFAWTVQAEAQALEAAAREREQLDRAEQEETDRLQEALSAPAQTADLSGNRLAGVRRKYQPLRERNETVQRRAQTSKQLLELELNYFKPRLQALAPLSFANYLGNTLASSGFAAGMVAVAVVGAQVLTAFSAAGPLLWQTPPPGSAGITGAFEPPATQTLTLLPTSTIAPSQTPTYTSTPTLLVQATLPPGISACIPQGNPRETALVVAVIDGDTVDVEVAGQVLRVRYIGVDAPEQDQPLYGQAMEYNRSLVDNQTVTLIKDVSETDRFGRLLRYVIAGDTLVNEALVAQGYAEATAYAPDTACVSALETAQQLARAAALGLWLPAEALVPPVTGADATPGCDPAYPGVCIPPSPPDLDCGDIPFRRFQVLPPDPHRFDRDADGVGCES